MVRVGPVYVCMCDARERERERERESERERVRERERERERDGAQGLTCAAASAMVERNDRSPNSAAKTNENVCATRFQN